MKNPFNPSYRIALAGILAAALAFVSSGQLPAYGQSVIATITVNAVPIDAAVDADRNLIYVSNQNAGTVTVIDGASNNVIGTIPIGLVTRGIDVNPATNRIYVGVRTASLVEQVAVIDGETLSVIALVTLNGSAEVVVGGIAVNPNTNLIYIAINVGDAVLVLDGASNAIIASIPVPGQPLAVAVNPVTNRIYAGQSAASSVTVIDGATQEIIATIPVGPGTQAHVAVNPITDRVYATSSVPGPVKCFEPFPGKIFCLPTIVPTVAVIDGASNTILTEIEGELGDFRALGLNPVSNRIYVADFSFGAVYVIDGNTNAVMATVPVGFSPGPGGRLGVNSITGRVYVPNAGDNTVSVIQDWIEVAIDVKPGSEPNAINLKGHAPAAGGVLPVAILSSEDFDATLVNKGTVQMGDPDLSGTAMPIRATVEDVNDDGLPDLLLHFGIQQMLDAGAINEQTVDLWLTGEMLSGVGIFGADAVVIVP